MCTYWWRPPLIQTRNLVLCNFKRFSFHLVRSFQTCDLILFLLFFCDTSPSFLLKIAVWAVILKLNYELKQIETRNASFMYGRSSLIFSNLHFFYSCEIVVQCVKIKRVSDAVYKTLKYFSVYWRNSNTQWDFKWWLLAASCCVYW